MQAIVVFEDLASRADPADPEFRDGAADLATDGEPEGPVGTGYQRAEQGAGGVEPGAEFGHGAARADPHDPRSLGVAGEPEVAVGGYNRRAAVGAPSRGARAELGDFAGGRDPADRGGLRVGEPEISFDPDRDRAGRAFRRQPGAELGDLTVGGDAPDRRRRSALVEPEVAVGPSDQIADDSLGAEPGAESGHLAARRHPPDRRRALLARQQVDPGVDREPDVAVRADDQVARFAVGVDLTPELGHLAGGRDQADLAAATAPQLLLETGEPDVPARPGDQRPGRAAKLEAFDQADRLGGHGGGRRSQAEQRREGRQEAPAEAHRAASRPRLPATRPPPGARSGRSSPRRGSRGRCSPRPAAGSRASARPHSAGRPSAPPPRPAP